MSKAHMVVLGFLNNEPMYGYKIGQMVTEQNFSVWAGIKLPSIYKALQTLESGDYICGEQIAEGNNPPRTVFSICPKGREYLRKLLYKALTGDKESPLEFWIALSFSNRIFTKEEMLQVIDLRLQLLSAVIQMHNKEHCHSNHKIGNVAFAYQHLVNLGRRFHKDVVQTLEELKADIIHERLNDNFIKKGELN